LITNLIHEKKGSFEGEISKWSRRKKADCFYYQDHVIIIGG